MKYFKSSLFVLLLIFCLSAKVVVPASRKSTGGRLNKFASQQVLVKYKPHRVQQIRALFARRYKTIKEIKPLQVDVLRVPDGETVDSFTKKLSSYAEVEFVEPNYAVRASFTPDDFANQYYLQSNILNMEATWDITRGIASVVVAVLDTGVALDHPDISPNLWINPNPSGNSGLHGTTIEIDGDGDGICNEAGDQCASPTPDDNNGPPFTASSVFHGTHVAGIIAAVANNSREIAGIAHNSRIMAVKVLDSNGDGYMSFVAEGIIYATDNGASIINLSLGGDNISEILRSAVQYARNRNVVVIAAAGNIDPRIGETCQTGCTITYPAAFGEVLAVSATDSSDQIACFSCSGPEMDIAAPGDNILSLAGSNVGPASGTSVNDGTSFAAPMVSGVAALIRSLDPSMPVQDVERYLTFYSVDLGAPGVDPLFGFGRMDALASVQAAEANTPFITNPTEPGTAFSYPNPFTPQTGNSVTFSLPLSMGSDELQIKIFNVAGERIKTLTDTNEWDGKNDDGRFVSSGVYFYYAQTKRGNTKGNLTLIK
ncbi:hypothetical protein BVX98_02410 [bacterium F11]|nr:hypothetical protein BVX98_02410 [bacterium F11]